MDHIRRATSPFRFQIPDDLIEPLRDLQARQQKWSPVIDSEDVVHLFYGLGVPKFLTFDGRVLADPTEWDGTNPYEVIDSKEAWSSIIVGASLFKFPELLRLLPKRPANAHNCSQCHGTGSIKIKPTNGKQVEIVCADRCGGLGWVSE